jgi:hypothetical protein
MARPFATPELMRSRFRVGAGSFAAADSEGDGAGNGDVDGANDGAGEAALCWNKYPRTPARIRATAIVPAIFMAPKPYSKSILNRY